METTLGKLRNMTTGIMHTEVKDVYLFCEEYLGAKGIMTHQLPSAFKAMLPILKRKLSDAPEWFTDEWIKEGLSTVILIPDLTEDEKKEFWDSYKVLAGEMWDNIKDKTIILNT